MNSEQLLKAINSLFTFMINNPLNSSEEILDSNILKKIFNELDEEISKNLKLKYDNSLTSTILNITEVKTQLLKILKNSSFIPTEQFNEEIEKLDISKVSNKNQKYLDTFIQLILISTLYCKERKTFTTKVNSENKKVLNYIFKKHLKVKQTTNTSTDKMNRTMKVGKSPLRKMDVNNENKEKSKREKSSDKNININNEKVNQTMRKGFPKMNINFNESEKELRDKLDNEISITMEKDAAIKELEDRLISSNKIENQLKEELLNLNGKIEKQNKLIDLYQKNESLNKNKIKSLEEVIQQLNVKLEKVKESRNKFNPDIFDNCQQEFELISGAMYQLGVIFWGNKAENYSKKVESDWLEKERLSNFN